MEDLPFKIFRFELFYMTRAKYAIQNPHHRRLLFALDYLMKKCQHIYKIVNTYIAIPLKIL